MAGRPPFGILSGDELDALSGAELEERLQVLYRERQLLVDEIAAGARRIEVRVPLDLVKCFRFRAVFPIYIYMTSPRMH